MSRSSLPVTLFTLALIAAMVCLAVQDASRGSLPQAYFRGWASGKLDGLPAWCAMVDKRMADLSDGHSVLIRLSNWNPKDNGEREYADLLRRRGDFALCPHRLYIEFPGYLDQPPITPQWLSDHDVRTVEWIVAGKDDRVWSAVYRLKPGEPAPSDPPPRPAVTVPWDWNLAL